MIVMAWIGFAARLLVGGVWIVAGLLCALGFAFYYRYYFAQR